MDLVNPIVRSWQRDAATDPESFWARAAEALPWFRKWDEVFEPQPPTFRWFLGARTNLAHNCLDHHVERGWGGHAALIYEREDGFQQTLTYAQLLHRVELAAAGLRGIGIGRGDRVAIYMPTCPEAITMMLACVRVGAIHIVVFAGFGAGALGERIKLAEAKAVFTTDVTWRKGKEVPLKGIVDRAVDESGWAVKRVVVVLRGAEKVAMKGGRDLTWDEFIEKGAGAESGVEEMESNDPAFILATSGTTAKPKLAVHTQGPYQVLIRSMAEWVFDLKESDIWWSTSDIGWIVGHSYIVYAPLLVGSTTIAFEGALDHPDAETFYRIVEENAVTGVFTSPTAVRLLMRYGVEPSESYDLASLERVFCAGEVLNAPAWEWLQKEVLGDRIPVLDHMWQTETSGPIVGNPYGLQMVPIKPGSSGLPLPGIDAAIIGPDGEELGPNEKGIFVIKRPFPGLTPMIWGDPDRYAADYWGKVPGKQLYYSGDSASIDEDGYVWFSGRADEIIKIAGHRIGTIEVETAFMRNPAVAEAGVTGRPDELRGEVISAFVVLRKGNQRSEALRKQLLATVRAELGPVAVIGELNFVEQLPKTRSGKIMRRVLKAVTLGVDPGDVSTIEEEGSIDDARHAWKEMKSAVSKHEEKPK